MTTPASMTVLTIRASAQDTITSHALAATGRRGRLPRSSGPLDRRVAHPSQRADDTFARRCRHLPPTTGRPRVGLRRLRVPHRHPGIQPGARRGSRCPAHRLGVRPRRAGADHAAQHLSTYSWTCEVLEQAPSSRERRSVAREQPPQEGNRRGAQRARGCRVRALQSGRRRSSGA